MLAVLLTVISMILIYVSNYFILVIPILWIVSFIKNFREDSEYRREIGAYTSLGYNIVHRECSFKYGDFFAADEENGYLLKDIGTHTYSINHNEKEIHIYR